MEDYIGYVIINPKGGLVLASSRVTKKWCIDDHILNSTYTWKAWQKQGWKCKKITVKIL